MIIGNNKAISSDKVIEQKALDDEEEDEEDEIIVDENQQDEPNEKQKSNARTSNNNLRCRQCDYEADDLSDLLLHRKGHALIKGRMDFEKKYNSDIENDDNQPTDDMFDYG